ncbi:MAG: PH domain-containing protein, partial [Candidatus Dormibacteraceae bacterium]
MSRVQPGLGAPPPPPPTGDRLEIPWRRLNARMLIVRPLSDLVRFIPGIALLFLLGHAQGRGNWWGLIGVGVALAYGVYRWFTTTFRISAEQVQVRSGLVNRKTLTVPIDRVRTVDVTAPALHRLLGLARVTVGTGQSDRKDDLLKLDALGATEAELLAGELLHRHRQVVAEGAPESTPGAGAAPRPVPGPIGGDARQGELVRFEGSWIRFGPFTLSGLVTVFIVAGFVARYVSEVGINYGQLPGVAAAEQRAAAGGLIALIVVLALLLIAIVVVLSTLSYVVAFWGFQVSRQAEGTLQVRRGLITTRVVTIEERRLRGVELSEPLLLRLVRGARCLAITTGLRVGRGAERGGSMLLPPGPRAVAERVAGDVLGDRRPLRAP